MNIYVRFEREFRQARGRLRVGLLVWFLLQWVLVPVELSLRLVWWPVAALFGDDWNAQGLGKPLARVVWPSRFALLFSHSQDRWERHLGELIRRHAGKLQFVPGDQGEETAISGTQLVASARHGLMIPPREYGPLSADRIRRSAAAAGLWVGLNARNWLILRPASAQAGYPQPDPYLAPQVSTLEREFVQMAPKSHAWLVFWLVAQWILVPLDLAWRIALFAVLIFANYTGDGPDLSVSAAWKRWMGMSRFRREWSRDPNVWEARLAAALGPIAGHAHQAAAPPRQETDKDGRPYQVGFHVSIDRDDFGTLPLHRILAISQAHGIHGWRYNRGKLYLGNAQSV